MTAGVARAKRFGVVSSGLHASGARDQATGPSQGVHASSGRGGRDAVAARGGGDTVDAVRSGVVGACTGGALGGEATTGGLALPQASIRARQLLASNAW